MHGAAEGDIVESEAPQAPVAAAESTPGKVSLAAKPLKIATTPEELIPGVGDLHPQSFAGGNGPRAGRNADRESYRGLLDMVLVIGAISLVLLMVGGFYLLRAHREKS